eukprot:1139347-Pelagomonas_calceolata.AAC.5
MLVTELLAHWFQLSCPRRQTRTQYSCQICTEEITGQGVEFDPGVEVHVICQSGLNEQHWRYVCIRKTENTMQRTYAIRWKSVDFKSWLCGTSALEPPFTNRNQVTSVVLFKTHAGFRGTSAV